MHLKWASPFKISFFPGGDFFFVLGGGGGWFGRGGGSARSTTPWITTSLVCTPATPSNAWQLSGTMKQRFSRACLHSTGKSYTGSQYDALTEGQQVHAVKNARSVLCVAPCSALSPPAPPALRTPVHWPGPWPPCTAVGQAVVNNAWHFGAFFTNAFRTVLSCAVFLRSAECFRG